jgi:hypothetical protein
MQKTLIIKLAAERRKQQAQPVDSPVERTICPVENNLAKP